MSSKPPRLQRGDSVRFVSPASPPDRAEVARGAEIVSSWGLHVEMGAHVFDTWGHYLAGRDEDRLADINDALRDPSVRAIFCTRGGKGSYRIADRLDFDALRRDPKPIIGFSDITILHLACWRQCRAIGFHGPLMSWADEYYGPDSADRLRRALMEPTELTFRQDPAELTVQVVVDGNATGILMGGNLALIATAVGWACPSFAGAILLVEAVDMAIGRIDCALTQLIKSGSLDNLRGVAIGQFIRSADARPGKWSVVEVLRDRLAPLGVPVLGGLPIGHGPGPPTVPLGTTARIDTTARTLTVEAGVD